jgi:NTP pyrophosphatase (non-canonical NTP hydrolase)
MDLGEIQQKQRELILERKWERFNATQVFSHLIEELGEIVSHFLYKEEYKVKGIGHQGNNTDLEEEFGQSFNLFLQLAYLAKVDLSKAWIREHERMKTRFPKDE